MSDFTVFGFLRMTPSHDDTPCGSANGSRHQDPYKYLHLRMSALCRAHSKKNAAWSYQAADPYNCYSVNSSNTLMILHGFLDHLYLS